MAGKKADILEKIIAYKRDEVKAAIEKVSEREMIELASRRTERRPFLVQFKREGVNIIAEIKRASPSKGMIREDLDVFAQAKAYENGGAAAVSVLTDEHFFKGSPEFIEIVRKSVDLPILRKEFIVSTYQIYEAVHIGADAVLLIVAALEPDELEEYIGLCRRLNLDALVEVHSLEEYEIADKAGAELIGINNRNLKTFEVDLQTSIDVFGHYKKGQVPVAESGIKGPGDIKRLVDAGINNFLIGESLVRTDDPAGMLRELRGVV